VRRLLSQYFNFALEICSVAHSLANKASNCFV
jgi:hypothetical protein